MIFPQTPHDNNGNNKFWNVCTSIAIASPLYPSKSSLSPSETSSSGDLLPPIRPCHDDRSYSRPSAIDLRSVPLIRSCLAELRLSNRQGAPSVRNDWSDSKLTISPVLQKCMTHMGRLRVPYHPISNKEVHGRHSE